MDKEITLRSEDNEEVRFQLLSNNNLSIKIVKPSGDFYTVYVDAKTLSAYLNQGLNKEETIPNSRI